MPDKQSDLSIVIEAVNNASGKIKEVEKDIKNTDVLMSKNFDTYKLQGDKLKHFQESEKKYWQEYNQSLIDLNTEMGRFSSSSDKASSALGDLSMEAAMGALKMAGLTIAISEVVSLLGEAVRIAGQFESSILGVSATARIFGQDVDRTKSAIVSLTEDGLMNQIQAAEGLQEIMTTGLGLEESIGLMERFKDVAAFGGKNTLDYNNKVQMLFESFKTGYSEQAKSAGLMLTWNEIIEVGARKLGKKVENLTLAEKAMAKYLGIMEVTAGEENQAALLTDTYAGTVSELNNAKTELMNTIGQGLMPVMVEFMKTLTVTIKKLAGLKVVAQAIATVFQGLQFIAKETGNYISGIVAMIINTWGILIEEASKITIDPRSWLESGRNVIQRFGKETKTLWNVIKDDAIICQIHAIKIYSQQPRTEINISPF